jgi:hypothetical protein
VPVDTRRGAVVDVDVDTASTAARDGGGDCRGGDERWAIVLESDIAGRAATPVDTVVGPRAADVPCVTVPGRGDCVPVDTTDVAGDVPVSLTLTARGKVPCVAVSGLGDWVPVVATSVATRTTGAAVGGGAAATAGAAVDAACEDRRLPLDHRRRVGALAAAGGDIAGAGAIGDAAKSDPDSSRDVAVCSTVASTSASAVPTTTRLAAGSGTGPNSVHRSGLDGTAGGGVTRAARSSDACSRSMSSATSPTRWENSADVEAL